MAFNLFFFNVNLEVQFLSELGRLLHRRITEYWIKCRYFALARWSIYMYIQICHRNLKICYWANKRCILGALQKLTRAEVLSKQNCYVSSYVIWMGWDEPPPRYLFDQFPQKQPQDNTLQLSLPIQPVQLTVLVRKVGKQTRRQNAELLKI